ncbi:hypothetical protein C8Q78DRAFT_984281 [Trametes maxima]|nr:hypothetical protein C8Q78DRAFT_984281 [Trametes maxima]
MPSIVVDDKGTELSYIDSGVPASASNAYTTIFAVHGTVFTSPIFEKVSKLAGPAGLRFVAINRRDYPGSTPLTAEDSGVLASGTDEQKAAFLKARGVELATFVDRFAEQNNVPAISADGKSGGFALLGWSLGNAIALAAVANVDALSAPSQARWSSGLRSLILYEPPTVAIGSALPPKIWSPQIDQSIPAELRGKFFTQWITSYFKHGDLSTRDLDTLSYVVPATFRAPSIYGIPDADLARIVYDPPGSGSDMLFMVFSAAQINAAYKKAVFDKGVRTLLPKLKVFAFTGDVTCPFSIPAFWALQDDDKAHGGGFIETKIVEGINHFVHWDEPELALKIYQDAL